MPTPLPSGPEIPSDLLTSSTTLRERERQRLQALDRSGLLDAGTEERFDRLTRRAQSRFGVSTAIISLIAEDRQYLKSFAGPFPRTVERHAAFCNVTIQSDRTLVVPDLLADARFRDNPLVTGTPYARFYAGVPLRGPGGWFVGSMCILDTQPRDLDRQELVQLRRLADEAELEVNGAGSGLPTARRAYDFGAKSSSAMLSGSRNSRM